MPTAVPAAAGPCGSGRSTAAARLLLLVLVAIGVVGMHTLGHPDDAAAAPAASVAGPAAHALSSDAAHDCPAGHCAPAGALLAEAVGTHHTGGHDSSGHGMDPASMCLAVFLTALGALTLGAAWLAVRRRWRGPNHTVRAWWSRLASGLPPPVRPDLSRLQVLRI